MSKNICILYFSGTGNTKIIAELLSAKLKSTSVEVDVDLISIENILNNKYPFIIEVYDIIGFAYPVHAFNAPKIIFDFVKTLHDSPDKKAFIIQTAGEESVLNDGSTIKLKKRLTKKGFRVFHESLIAMPSNFIVKYDDKTVKKLYNDAVSRIQAISHEILIEQTKQIKAGIFSRLLSFVFQIETLGAPFMGKLYTTTKACTGCNYCIKKCPRNNILNKNGKIKFGWSCIICMRCLYTCPNNAIYPRIFSFIKIKDGYDIKKLLK